MTTFSTHFGLNKKQHQLDFVDIDPEWDMSLFIDPYALSQGKDEFSEICTEYITSFFQELLNSIISNDDSAKTLLNGLHEPNETCLGLSLRRPNGRGVGNKQALDLYTKFSESTAAKSGLLTELADCDLFVKGIGKDKISDMCTNILRKLLIGYTQDQCHLHNIRLEGKVACDNIWNLETKRWTGEYESLPIINNKKIILIPKHIVRRSLCIKSKEYYENTILNFLMYKELENSSSMLTRALKNGAKKVCKKDLRSKYPCSKDLIVNITKENPHLLEEYKLYKKQQPFDEGVLRGNQESEDSEFAEHLIDRLNKIPLGEKHASKYHDIMIGIVQYVFANCVATPRKEHRINDGDKRIDILYTNIAKSGFFFSMLSNRGIGANYVHVGCKNYSEDIKNPEIDQLSGRFNKGRGELGILLYRKVANYNKLIKKCHDSFFNNRGLIIPLGDEEICEMLRSIKDGNREKIDKILHEIHLKIIN